MSTIKGEFVTHTLDRGFIYKYKCPSCQRDFHDTAPELSTPTLCRRCYHGDSTTVIWEVEYAKKRKSKE